MKRLLSKGFSQSRDLDGGGLLCIRCADPAEVLASIKPDREYVVEIKEPKKHRSLDANAYFWQLAGKLAGKLGISAVEVYRQYIHDIGDNFEIVRVLENRLEHWDRVWCSGHLGRLTEDAGPCRDMPGYHNVLSYVGSSDYTPAQMRRLIELVVQDCKAQGIETMTPMELARLEGYS